MPNQQSKADTFDRVVPVSEKFSDALFITGAFCSFCLNHRILILDFTCSSSISSTADRRRSQTSSMSNLLVLDACNFHPRFLRKKVNLLVTDYFDLIY